MDLNISAFIQNPSSGSPSAPPEDMNAITPTIFDGLGADDWNKLIREELENLALGQPLNPKCLIAPRRRHADEASAALAFEIVAQLYPAPGDPSLSQVIKYEKHIVTLRKSILAQDKAKEEARRQDRLHRPWKGRVKAQRPWDEINDPWSLAGAAALPMPATISDEESLAPFFAHIGEGGTFDNGSMKNGMEPIYGGGGEGVITRASNLRTLDLDQTELGDEGVPKLFNKLNSYKGSIPLRNIYLNGTGIGSKACEAIADYLSQPNCALEALYISCNPIGDAGALALARGLGINTSLLRLSMTSYGLKSPGAGTTPDEVNHSQSGNQIMVGAGGVVAVMLSAYFG
ncbi:MAG: hypothetical protein Q9218_003238 [Villophora microphyllina]